MQKVCPVEGLIPLRYPVCQQTTNDKEQETASDNKCAGSEDISIYPLTIRRYDLYDVIRNRINKVGEKQVGEHSPKEETQTYKKEDQRYTNRGLPRPTQRPLPFPIKHISIILNWVKRRVKHSGKEPLEEGA